MVVFPASRAAWPSRTASFRAVSSGPVRMPRGEQASPPFRGKSVAIADASPARRITGVAERSLPKSGDPSPNPRGGPARCRRPVRRVRRTILPFPVPDRAARGLRPTARKGTVIVAADHPEPTRFLRPKRKTLLPRRTSLIVVLTADRGAIAGHRGLWRRPGRLRSAGVPAFRNVAPRMSTDDSCARLFGCCPPVCDRVSCFRSGRCDRLCDLATGAGFGRDRLRFVRPVVPT